MSSCFQCSFVKFVVVIIIIVVVVVVFVVVVVLRPAREYFAHMEMSALYW